MVKSYKDMLPYYARKIVQYLSFSLFLYLLLFVDPLAERDLWANVFLRMSPLSAIGAMVAAKVFIAAYWPALIILLLAIPFGRFFCAWVCPLGTTIDVADRCFAPLRKSAQKGIYDGRRVKYYLLAFLLISLFFGLQLAGWFDPISLATGVYAICVHPYVVSLINSILGGFSGVPVVGYLFDLLRQSIHAALFAQHAPFFRGHGILLVVFVILISFGMVLRRYWCRNLCPMGALFALFSDWSIFRRTVSSSCTNCGICIVNCGMGAIGESGRETREGECVLCMTCLNVCPENSIAFRHKQSSEQNTVLDLSKRSFLLTGVLGAVVAPLVKMNYAKAVNKGKASLIRPPGAVDEAEFVALCIRCGECMKVCKTNGLHPVLLEGGIEAVWTPKLIPRLGYCDYGCVLCTRVCPSGALRRLELDEKREVSLGKARIDHNRCIPWAGYARLPELEKEWQDFNCGVCEEVCPVPTKAIHFNTYVDAQQREIRRPFVREDVCIGCGFCEKVCPVLGTSAIVVEGIQPQTKIKSVASAARKGTAGISVNNFLPNTLGEWKRVSAPDIFDGKERLFEFIDGGAEPYLSYSFIRVATVEYQKAPDKKASVEIWEFGYPEDAFGVFSKDRVGVDIKLGNGSALFGNYLFLWNDVYFIKIEPRDGGMLPDETVFIGKSIINVMPYKKAQLPSITAFLPPKHLVQETIRFFHRKIVLDNISISDNFTEENVFGLSEKTDAVIAEYKPDGNEEPLKLMVVKYPDARLAAAALQNALKTWRTWGEEAFTSGAISSFESKTHRYTSFMQQGNILFAVFFAESRVSAEGLLNDVLNF